MIRKTEAIVLNTRNFGDTSLICSTYTRLYGRHSFLVKGYRSPRAKKRHSYFQPMSIIDVVFYYKETRDLQIVTESSSGYFYHELQTVPVKIALGMLVVDIFGMCVKEEERNDPLFNFLSAILISLDECPDRLIHIFIYYLVHLSRYLGFFPRVLQADPAKAAHFDIRSGTIQVAAGPPNPDTMLLRFLLADLPTCRDIQFSNADKADIISTMFQYYRIHVEGFQEPASWEVLREFFK